MDFRSRGINSGGITVANRQDSCCAVENNFEKMLKKIWSGASSSQAKYENMKFGKKYGLKKYKMFVKSFL